MARIDQKIGQIGSNIDASTINAELDHIHDRINRTIVGGDIMMSRRVVDSKTTILPNDSYIGVDTSFRLVGLTLPRVSEAIPNRLLIIKDEKNNAATLNITVYPFSASETIDKATSKVISTNLGVLRLFCTGTEWFSL